MKKNLLFKRMLSLLTILGFSQMLLAEPVDPQTAAIVGKHFFQSTRKGQALAENVNLDLVYGANQAQANGTALNLLYVFNVNNHGGYVIVAADDAVQPILGYSDEGAFEAHSSIEKWLEGYKSEIFSAIENKIPPTAEIRTKWSGLKTGVPTSNLQENGGVGPLLESTWNQSPNENALCPGGSVTGCVATAMAQIMYYWKYPVQGVGSHSYFEQGSASVPSYGILSADFGATTYQWGSMPFHANTPNNNISLLMLHCGISLDMDYSPSSSGAYTQDVPNALKKYFKYDPNTVTFVSRSAYSDAEWINLLKQELNAFRPMHYRGTGSAGGHSFVCDGYDDNNFFHFNWGWGGSSDGFFAVNALNPGTLGTGGGSGGFNTSQGAVIGIQPDPAATPDLVMTSVFVATSVVTDGGTVTVFNTTFANTGSQNFDGDVTLGIFNAETGALVNTSPSIIDYFSIGGAGAFVNGDFALPLLPPGFYNISLLYRLSATGQWAKIPEGQFSNHFPLVVTTPSPIYLTDIPVIAPAVIQPNTAVSVTATLTDGSTMAPVFLGSLSASLHRLDGSWLQDIATIDNQLITFNNPVNLTFHTNSLNADPGTYLVVFWANGGNGWQKVNVSTGINPTVFITVLAPTLAADSYEQNGSQATAANLPLNFAGNIALISTFGSNHHVSEDEDFYKVAFPSDPSYIYFVKGTLNDASYQPNGGNYTDDCIWRFNDGNSWSAPFDDVLQVPDMGFLVKPGATAYFYVKSFFAGTTGTYLLELEITRLPAFDAPCGAINLPVNGVEQTGFSNAAATAYYGHEPGIPVAGDCMGNVSWCNTEGDPRLQHSVWFTFQAPPSGSVEISTCGMSNFDTQLALYSASDCGNIASYALLAANDDGPNCAGFTSLLQASGLIPGQTYYILLDGYEDATGNIGISITPIQATAVKNLEATPDVLLVSPNPSAGLLNIQFKGDAPVKGFKLTDMNGKLLLADALKDGAKEQQLELDWLPNGVYLLQVQTEDKMFTQKVIIQR